MSRRLLLTTTMAVIVSLTLTGSALADGFGTLEDPAETAKDLVDEAERFAEEGAEGASETTGGGTTDAEETMADLLSEVPSDPDCQRDLSGDVVPAQTPRDDCNHGKTGSDPTPTQNETGAPPKPELPLDSLWDFGAGLQDEAGKSLEEVSQEGSNLIRAIWKPLQGASQEAGRFIHDAYEATTKAVGQTSAQATSMAGYLIDEATHKATGAVTFIVDQATGVLQKVPVLGDLLGDEEQSLAGQESSQGMGPRSATVETPEGATMAIGMILASGIGLALAGLAVLRRLLGFGGVALLSRIPTSQLMKNGTRNAIFEIVRTDPGVSLNEIVDRMALSRNAVAYHLAVFESEKLMTSVKDGKYRRYFLNGGRYVNGAKDVVAAIKNEKTLDVIRYIASHPGVIQKDVCSAVGTSPSATSWHIRRLERVGLVEKQREANTVRYSPGPNLAKYDLSEFGLTGKGSDQPHAPEVAVQTA